MSRKNDELFNKFLEIFELDFINENSENLFIETLEKVNKLKNY